MPDLVPIASGAFVPTLRPPTLSASGVTAIIPHNIQEVLEVARVIILAKLAPASYEGRTEEETRSRIVIGIMKGSEVGFPPITALSTIAIINNRACIWGDGAVALVQSKGVVDRIEESWEGGGEVTSKTDPMPNDFADDFACIFKIWRKGQSNPYIGRYSVRDAKRAHLWGRKQPWQQYPKRMLLARARAYALRDGFADCLMGLAIAEEIQDLPVEAVKPSLAFLDDAPLIEAPPVPDPVNPVPTPEEIAAHHATADTPAADGIPDALPRAAILPRAEPPAQHDGDHLDSPGSGPHRPPLAGPEPDPVPVVPEPTAAEIAMWSEWGTKMTEKLATCTSSAVLAKLESHFQAQSRDYLAVLGAEKRLAMEELIAQRRQELSSK